ncbi:MAG: FadR/GntR family transcriptional regulator [Anaerolineae bacterium]
MFEKATPTRTFEDVACQVRQAIVSGELQPNDRLPSQRQLAETFGVSRSTLLAGLRILEQEGLIVIRPGATGGAFVTAPDIERVSESLDLFLKREGASLQELVEFREKLEGSCVSWGASRASDAELAEVWRLLEQLRQYYHAPRTTWQEFLDREIRFHLTVAKLSHNRVSVAVLQAIHTTTTRFIRQIPPGYGDRVLQDWEAIMEAMSSRQPEEAARRMSQHIAFFSQLTIEHARRDNPLADTGAR